MSIIPGGNGKTDMLAKDKFYFSSFYFELQDNRSETIGQEYKRPLNQTSWIHV